MEHRLIATTMLAVGLFAVLSWDATFPDRRDVMVLAPLPVRARTLFYAKVAASGTVLALSTLALHVVSGITWPLVLAHGGLFGIVRSIAAYWFTMFTAGAFLFCSVLTVQEFAAQLLPRRYFLRLSAFLQLAAFCLFLGVVGTCVAFSLPVSLPANWILRITQVHHSQDYIATTRRALLVLAVPPS